MQSQQNHDHSKALDTILGAALLVLFVVVLVYGAGIVSALECARGVQIECVN